MVRARATWLLIVASVAVFLADMLSQRALLDWGAKSFTIWTGDYYRLFTATLLHSDIRHLLFNMYALYMFGRVVETVVGSSRFICVYFLSGATGYMLSLLVMPSTPAIGASAAIFGLIGYTIHYRLRRLPLRYLRIDTDMLQILGLNLLIGFMVPNIDQMAHLGGLLGGMLAASLVGMPVHTQQPHRRLGEVLFAVVLLVVITSVSLQPLVAAKRIQPVAPKVAGWLDAKYGPYFSPLFAESVMLLWSQVKPNSQWEPAPPEIRLGSRQLVRLATFWRWEKGPVPLSPVTYQVLWESISPNGTAQIIQVDRNSADKPHPNRSLVYGGSDIVVGPGNYRVYLDVSGRRVWHSSVEIVEP